ncbi:MAG TPA: hypothetical protein VHB93_01325 [Candidatus Paceibacterota bacterium]|nr:hypothetical protein [Candidatus Paceibacterota bacterium]
MPPQNPPVPPGDAFQSRAGAGHSARLFIVLIIALLVVVLAGWYLFTHSNFGGSPNTVTFVSAHSAESYHVASSNTFSSPSDPIQKLGPITAADGTQYMAVLATAPLPTAPAGQPPPVVVAPPAPEWMLYRGTTVSASSSLGVGRPLGTMADGTLLAITDTGLVALVPGGTVSLTTAPSDLVAAAKQDGSVVAMRNSVSRAIDLYSIAPKSLQKSFLGTINEDPLALTFGPAGDLYVIATTSAVNVYTVSATAAPSLAATSTLPNPWP